MRVRFLVALAFLTAAPVAYGQGASFPRLPPDVLDVTPPAARVEGGPGEMTIQRLDCRTVPLHELRRRIVDVAVQEWGVFGFPVRDETTRSARPPFGRQPGLSEHVATTVAGYWAVTPQAAMMVARQNGVLNGSGRQRADPWSAAFVSWVMCEAGLGDAGRFQRAIAHHAYIDQAIRARDGRAPEAAFVAYDTGEAPIVPGDLLCAARRPAYRTIAERRRQMGVGARSHCDIVVKVDEPGGRILTIGGNVRRSVSLKLLPAVRGAAGHLHPAVIDDGRPVFAHLKLRAEPIEAHALDNSPTIRALDDDAGR